MNSPLKQPAFLRYWLGRICTTMGNNMLLVALGWQMYDTTHSAWDLGLVGLCQFLPALLLTLVVGQVADRHDRRRVLMICLCTQMSVALALTLAALEHSVGRDLILVASLGIGAVRAFQMPTQQALAPLLVSSELLPRALALNGAGMQAAIIVGPALGGFIYAAGAEAVYAFGGLLFLVAILFMASVRLDHAPTTQASLTMRSVFAGITFVWRQKILLGAISLDMFAVLLGGATALLPMFARDILHVDAWGFGLLYSAPAAGALGMSLWLSRHPIERRVGKILFASVAVYGGATFIFAISTSFVLSLLVLSICGAADMVSVVIRQTLVQLDTPNEMRGRVSAVNSIFIGSSNQLGEFESGATAALLGPVGSVVAGSIGTLLVVAAWSRLFPALMKRERLTAS